MADAAESKTSTKRKHGRIRLSILVQYRFHPYEDFLYEYTTDVSPGGVFLRTEAVRAVGSTVYLQFAPQDGSMLIEAVGRVAHVARPGHGTAGMGVEFMQLDEKSEKRIHELCDAQGRKPARK